MSIADILIRENYFLAEISEELQGTLCCIAYAGKHADKRFINRRQKYFKQYEQEISDCVSPLSLIIEEAYSLLQNINPAKDSEEDIRITAEEALQGLLLIENAEELNLNA